MDKLIVRALTFKADRKGVTALEYGIIASILGLVLVTIFTTLGSTLKTLFSTVATARATPCGSGPATAGPEPRTFDNACGSLYGDVCRPGSITMTHSALVIVLLSTGAALLAFAALHDVGFRTVPNRVSAALLAVGLLLRLIQGNLGAGLLCGLAVFSVTYAFWRFGWMGGADVKLLTASAVFVPPLTVPTLIVGTSLAGGLLAVIYLVGSRMAPRPARLPATPGNLLRRALRCELRRLRRRGPLPYATAIAAGGWLAIAAS